MVAPRVDVSGVVEAPIQIDGTKTHLCCGLDDHQKDATHKAGCRFSFNNLRLPNGFTTGDTEWLQVIDYVEIGVIYSNGSGEPTYYGSGRDNSAPYGNLPDGGVADAPYTVLPTAHNPPVATDVVDKYERFNATMYFLWEPQVNGAIYVPLSGVDWGFYMEANLDTSGSWPNDWKLDSASSGPEPETRSCTSEPVWTNTMHNTQIEQ